MARAAAGHLNSLQYIAVRRDTIKTSYNMHHKAMVKAWRREQQSHMLLGMHTYAVASGQHSTSSAVFLYMMYGRVSSKLRSGRTSST